jgi:hypothetical protein
MRAKWVDVSCKSLQASQTADHLQKALVTIAYAIANPRKPSKLFAGFSANYNLDKVDWDITRYADRVKNTHPRPDGEPAPDDVNLEKYFRNPELGDLDEPATIVDRFDRIMVWYLPGIFFACLMVSPTQLLFGSESKLSSS